MSNTFTCRPVNSTEPELLLPEPNKPSTAGRGNYEIVMLQANNITIFGARQQMNSEVDAAELFKYSNKVYVRILLYAEIGT